ncbi:outer membrane beta-barrel protein [Lysobacter koreensis]|uniref:Outer membrane beta-barrel protein n=1 Tax=Lysobacter koreensis TaxID=266122 RepID=A0ABW2YPI8_9GAMM
MKKQFVLAAMLAAAPFAATAGELSYTYVEGGYAKTHINDDDFNNPEGDGGFVRGSGAISPSFNVFGGVSRVTEEVDASVFGTPVDVEITQSELGLGYHTAMAENVDFLAELAWLRQDVDVDVRGFGSDGESFNGGRASIGLRGRMAAPLEGWVKAGYLDGGDFEGGFVGTLGGQFQFSPTWGLVGEVEFIEDTTQYRFGVRASF